MSKESLNLPKTAFSMKANLPNKEPEILLKWEKNKIFQKLRKNSKGKEKFILHDGPPYANCFKQNFKRYDYEVSSDEW